MKIFPDAQNGLGWMHKLIKEHILETLGWSKNRGNESWALAPHDHKNLTLECPHRCMHDQFCIKFPNHHFCICVMEIMWGIPFILEPNQTPTCIMSSHSTNLEPKSWLTIILTLGSKKEKKENFQSKRKQKEKKGNSQSKSGRKQKGKKGNSQSKSGRKQKEKKENSQPKNGRK